MLLGCGRRVRANILKPLVPDAGAGPMASVMVVNGGKIAAEDFMVWVFICSIFFWKKPLLLEILGRWDFLNRAGVDGYVEGRAQHAACTSSSAIPRAVRGDLSHNAVINV